MEVAIKLQEGVAAKVRKHGMHLGSHMITFKPQIVMFKDKKECEMFLASIQFKKYMVKCKGEEVKAAEKDALKKLEVEEAAVKKLATEKKNEEEAEANLKAEQEEATAAAKKAETKGD